MDRTIDAEYIAEEKVLKLAEPLAGIRNHETVRVTIKEPPNVATGLRSVKKPVASSHGPSGRRSEGTTLQFERFALDANASTGDAAGKPLDVAPRIDRNRASRVALLPSVDERGRDGGL
jgi:hypothetical protein